MLAQNANFIALTAPFFATNEALQGFLFGALRA